MSPTDYQRRRFLPRPAHQTYKLVIVIVAVIVAGPVIVDVHVHGNGPVDVHVNDHGIGHGHVDGHGHDHEP